MGKGKKKVVTVTKVKPEDASDIKEKETKENHPKMNGESPCNGQTTILNYLSPGKPRAPLHDNSVSLHHEGKLPPKRTDQNDTKKKGEARLDGHAKTELATLEEEGSPCPPSQTEVQASPRHSEAACLDSTAAPKLDNNGTHRPNKGRGTHRKAKEKSTQKPTESNHSQNRKVTDYYPIRRSSRKSKAELKCEEQQRIDDLIQKGIEDGLQVKYIEEKGRGVFATRSFQKGQFVVEYHGDLLHIKDAKKREVEYAQNPATGCYMYYFQYLSKTYCVDATKETNRLGRLINHSKNGNCQTKLHDINGIPHLILVASRDIEEGEELLYDYGDRSKASIAAHPWLKY
ncbi:lysine methyltransferase 5Ab [Megalops cyprinoides]|uniref:lysine methyltransferase 5Ab n=1 Tax=Megalops cyprinoides TaxID=118141 RepID=UPI0018649241|nr:lysine methyltransferase 5Ab [Megalops cyprinoides]